MRKSKAKGVSLVELIVAMVIIAITAVCSLTFFNFCQKNFIIPARLKFVASNLTREAMEKAYWKYVLIPSGSPTYPIINSTYVTPSAFVGNIWRTDHTVIYTDTVTDDPDDKSYSALTVRIVNY